MNRKLSDNIFLKGDTNGLMITLWIAVVQWLAIGTPTRTIRVRFPSIWLVHHGDNRGSHSANQNLLPEMQLHVITCRDSRLV